MPKRITLILLIMTGLAACAPERGSQAWCEQMDETPKGEWSVNDATEYAKSCVFRSSSEK